jgi:hypothetical protein
MVHGLAFSQIAHNVARCYGAGGKGPTLWGFASASETVSVALALNGGSPIATVRATVSARLS